MKRLALAVLILFSSQWALADGGLYLGTNSTNFSTSSDNVSFKGKSGFEAGYTSIVDIGWDAYLRTGLGLSLRAGTYTASSVDVGIALMMVEVPVTLLYDFGDIVAGFAGFNLNYAASVSISIGSEDNFLSAGEDFVGTFVGGFNVALTSNHVIEAYFESTLTDVFPDTGYTALGARYVYMFD